MYLHKHVTSSTERLITCVCCISPSSGRVNNTFVEEKKNNLNIFGVISFWRLKGLHVTEAKLAPLRVGESWKRGRYSVKNKCLFRSERTY